MKNQIINLKDLEGKTIVDTNINNGDLWFKFSDNTFAVLIKNDITEGFGYTKEEINLDQYCRDETEYALVELGLITKKEYKLACEIEELRGENLEEKLEQERKEIIKRMELEQHNKISKKYGV